MTLKATFSCLIYKILALDNLRTQIVSVMKCLQKKKILTEKIEQNEQKFTI